jgi:three-Cys-motif partner protein
VKQVDHEFGGHHTELKLSVIASYLNAYTKALRRIFKQLWYIDAFAGTGSRIVKHRALPATLFGDPPAPERIERLRGSAQIAIDTAPPFDALIFIEKKKSFAAALEKLKAQHPLRDIKVIQGDANKAIQKIIRETSWSTKRAVLFLDPYGMDVDWETLKAIARTRAIDVWYLFSLSGLYRQATVKLSKVDISKRKALDRILGSSDWEKDLYPLRPKMRTLMGDLRDIPRVRTKNVRALEAYMKKRLETIFGAVLEPLRLPREKGPQRYSLFLCISSNNPKAIEVATRIGNHILSAGNSS